MKKYPILPLVVTALLINSYSNCPSQELSLNSTDHRPVARDLSKVAGPDRIDPEESRIPDSMALLALLDGEESVDPKDGGQDSSAPKEAELPQATDSANETSSDTSNGAAIIVKARDSLLSYSSISAKIKNTIVVGDRQFSATGEYQQGDDLRLRLSYSVYLSKDRKTASGSLLQICDGQILWTQQRFNSNPDEKPNVTRRDVRRILAEAQILDNVPDKLLIVELGLGGLPALLASLQRSMDFESVKSEGDYTVVEGTWKQELRQGLVGRGTDKKQQLPEHVPDLVRIYFYPVSEGRIFPSRIQYRRIDPGSESSRPMVTIDFLDVEVDRPISDNVFSYVPPEGVVEKDMTDQYIKMLKEQAARATNREVQPQTP